MVLCVPAFFGLLFLDKRIDTIKGNAAVIADDAATAVCVGKTVMMWNDGRRASHPLRRQRHRRCGSCGGWYRSQHFGVNFTAVSFAGSHGHTDASVNHKGTLQRFVRLKTDDLLERLIDIACFVRGDGGDHLGVHINDPAVCRLLCKEIHDIGPKPGGCFGGAGQKTHPRRGIVFLDEIADINGVVPVTVGKSYAIRLVFCEDNFCAYLRQHTPSFAAPMTGAALNGNYGGKTPLLPLPAITTTFVFRPLGFV